MHGGATARRAPTTEKPGFEAKRILQTSEKQAVARAAAAMVEPGAAIGLSAGTTAWTTAEPQLHLDLVFLGVHGIDERAGMLVVAGG